LKVVVLEEVALSGELRLVSRAKLKDAFGRIGDRPELGKPLKRELAGCRRIHLGGGDHRLVYRETTMGGEDVVEVIAIGLRKDDQVYLTAAKRI